MKYYDEIRKEVLNMNMDMTMEKIQYRNEIMSKESLDEQLSDLEACIRAYRENGDLKGLYDMFCDYRFDDLAFDVGYRYGMKRVQDAGKDWSKEDWEARYRRARYQYYDFADEGGPDVIAQRLFAQGKRDYIALTHPEAVPEREWDDE